MNLTAKAAAKPAAAAAAGLHAIAFSACGLYSLELTLPDFIKKPHDLAASRLPAPSSCRLPHCCPQGPKSGPAIVTQGESNIKRRTDMHRKEAPALALSSLCCAWTPQRRSWPQLKPRTACAQVTLGFLLKHVHIPCTKTVRLQRSYTATWSPVMAAMPCRSLFCRLEKHGFDTCR